MQGERITYRMKAFGWLAACFFPGMFLLLGVTQKGFVSVAAWVIFLFVSAQFGIRLILEHRILRNPVVTPAVVTLLSGRPLEAGRVYSVKYRYKAEDGKEYVGKSSWGKVSVDEGEQITILYCRDQPSRSLPQYDFRFYEIGSGEYMSF